MKILRPSEATTFPLRTDLTPDELAEAYRLAKEAFTAEDLQRFTEIGDEIPAEAVLAELEEAQKQVDQRGQ